MRRRVLNILLCFVLMAGVAGNSGLVAVASQEGAEGLSLEEAGGENAENTETAGDDAEENSEESSAEAATLSTADISDEDAEVVYVDHYLATYCTVAIPPVFEPGKEKNVFVNKSYPMESSIIRCSTYDNGKDVQLTNREKQELADTEAKEIPEAFDRLTKEIYEETMSEAYNSEYGEDVGFEVSSFENIQIERFPGYKIKTSFKAQDEERIYQTVYILLSRYRTFTVTFQRAEDDDCESYFEECAATIRVH